MLAGLHKTITISFLPVGHTKFSPDWCFGLLKQKFRKSEVNCLDDFVSVVHKSADVNAAQLVGTQSGDVIVPTYNWSGYFSVYFRKIPHITSQHHFFFTSENPGKVVVKESINSPESTIDLLTDKQWTPTSSTLPDVIIPSGLPIERQWYLHDKIREFCPPDIQDLVCPKPLSVRPTTPLPPVTTTSSIRTNPDPDYENPLPPPAKKQRICSRCSQPGHNARTCQN